MAVRDILRNNWPTITIGVTAAVIVCAAVVMLRSMPPRVIVMATGPEGGAYHELGERYRAALGADGVEVRLVPTAGSVENLALLRDPRSGVSVALIQGGIIGAGNFIGPRIARDGLLRALVVVPSSAKTKVWGSRVCGARRYRSGRKAAAQGRWRSNCSGVTGLIGSYRSTNCWRWRRAQPPKSSWPARSTWRL